MATTKITLNELRSIVKQIIKEEMYTEINIVSIPEKMRYEKMAKKVSDLIKEYDKIIKQTNKETGGGNSAPADEWDYNFSQFHGFNLKEEIDKILAEWKRSDSQLKFIKDYLDEKDLERLKREKIIQ